MMTWDQQLAKLRSRHVRLGETEGMVALAEAYRELTAEYRWSFLLAESKIVTEPSVSTGTVAIDANTSLLTLASSGAPWSTSWKQRRVTVGESAVAYRVTSFGSTTTANLDATWPGANVSGASYTMYRALYEMPADCDYGRELLLWDCARNCELPLVSSIDMRRAQSAGQAQVGIPEAAARMEIQQSADGNLNPIEMIEFGPQAPSDAATYVAFYFRKLAAPAGAGKPVWPENYEDLLWRRAELLIEENPRHRIVLSRETRQKYASRLWALKKVSDGGAEIERRLSLMHEGSLGNLNVSFTTSGINPLVGG